MAGLWYRAGTVSVTNGSNKITGFGTTWKTGANRPDKGHTFWGPDGKHYEVDSIESDTVLYLVKAYTGATAAGQPYEIDITRTSTIPAVSREVAALLAYAQSQYDAWQAILTGSGDVTLTAPDGQTVTVPALANMLSKSGNLAGLTDTPTARNNLSLGDAATKNVGVAAGSVAAGDHKHFHMFTIGGDANTFYPVLLSGDVLRDGIAINRDVHLDGTWMGSLRLRIAGTGGAWGGDVACLDYRFTQFWGGNNTSGCLADVAASSVSDGLYLWLRGGRTYWVNGAGVSIDVYLSGRTEANGAVYSPKASGPLSGSYTACSLDGTQLFRGAPGNNNPYWHGENLPVTWGNWSPYVDDPMLSISSISPATWSRVGNVYCITAGVSIAGAGSLAGNRFALRGLPFNFDNIYRAINLYESSLLAGTPNKSAAAIAMVTASEIQFFYKTTAGDAAAVLQEQIRPNEKGNIELYINATFVR